MSLKKIKKIIIIEDCAEAIGAKIKGKYVGTGILEHTLFIQTKLLHQERVGWFGQIIKVIQY